MSRSGTTARPIEQRGFWLSVYSQLLEAIGPRGWWPADSPFEVMVGAILTQNTAWRNVEKAIRALKEAKVLSPEALGRIDPEELAALIRPAGYFNQKSARLKALAAFLLDQYGGSLERMRAEDTGVLREKLLRLPGVGPETADSILLYALEKPVFVVDAYTRRIFARHGWASPKAGYDEIRLALEAALPAEASLYNEFHALLVYVGQQFCKRRPECEQCPLRGYARVSVEEASPNTPKARR
jgi:endonuclease-3 related protein